MSGDRRPGSEWFYQQGVADDTLERTKERVTARKASSIEHTMMRDMGKYFKFFLPYVPLTVCPGAPDMLAEYCDKNNVDVELTFWDLDRQLVPQLASAGVCDTSRVFGIRHEHADKVFNFSRSVIVDDEEQKQYFRILLSQSMLLPSGVSLVQSAEKIRSSLLPIILLGVQTQDTWFYLQSKNLADYTFCKTTRPDKEIARMLRQYRKGAKIDWH